MLLDMEATKVQPRIDLTAPDPLSTVNRSAMARELSVSLSQVSRILSNKRRLHMELAIRIAAYLAISLDQLYRLLYPGGDTENSPPGS